MYDLDERSRDVLGIIMRLDYAGFHTEAEELKHVRFERTKKVFER